MRLTLSQVPSQNRMLDQGSIHRDPLTLPPLQAGNATGKTPEEIIMSASVIGKIQVLGKVSPPLPTTKDADGRIETRGSVK